MDTNHQQDKQQKGSLHPLVAGAVGAVVGAGVATVGAAVLQNDKTRGKVKKMLHDAQQQAKTKLQEKMDEMLDKGAEAEKAAEQKARHITRAKSNQTQSHTHK